MGTLPFSRGMMQSLLFLLIIGVAAKADPKNPQPLNRDTLRGVITPQTLFLSTLSSSQGFPRIPGRPTTTRVQSLRPMIIVASPYGSAAVYNGSPALEGTIRKPQGKPDTHPATTAAIGGHRRLMMASTGSSIRRESIATPTLAIHFPGVQSARMLAAEPSISQSLPMRRPLFLARLSNQRWQEAVGSAMESLRESPLFHRQVASLPATTRMSGGRQQIILTNPHKISKAKASPDSRKKQIAADKETAKALVAKATKGSTCGMKSNSKAKTAAKPTKTYMAIHSRRITVQAGMFATILTQGIKSVAIADPGVADVVVLSSRSVLINGKSRGSTNLVLWDSVGYRTYEVRVVDRVINTAQEIEKAIGLPQVRVRLIGEAAVLDGEVDSADQAAKAKAVAGLYADKIVDLLSVKSPVSTERPDLSKQIQEAIDIPGIDVRVVGDSVLLKGTVQYDTQKQQAERIASLYAPQVVNLLTVPVPEKKVPSATEISEMIGIPSIRVKDIHDRVILEGEAPDAAAKERAATIAALSGKTVDNQLHTPEEKLAAAVAKAKQIQDAIGIQGVTVQGTEEKLVLKGTVPTKDDEDRAVRLAKLYASEVVSMLEVPTQKQVRVELMIVEMNRGRLKDLGFIPGAGQAGYLLMDGSTTFGEGVNGIDSTALVTLSSSLKAMETKNQAKILSQPNATVLSGKQVTFQVGGQIPIPVSNSSTVSGGTLTQSVEFRDFGILMDVKPTVESAKSVNMIIKTEVSQPNFANAVNINGSVVPGFDTRKSDTEVIVKDGQTLVIGGLIKHEDIKNEQALPILSKIPILGELFTSRSFQRNETELVIFVTPHVSVITPD